MASIRRARHGPCNVTPISHVRMAQFDELTLCTCTNEARHSKVLELVVAHIRTLYVWIPQHQH